MNINEIRLRCAKQRKEKRLKLQQKLFNKNKNISIQQSSQPNTSNISFNSKRITNMLFSSVGDNSCLEKYWIDDKSMNYDIYLIYYGDDNNIYNMYKNNKKIKFISRRKGSKFQNFHYFYYKYSDIVNKYTHFFIIDDDIIIDVDGINQMFLYSNIYNLEICGPSFSNKGIISHELINLKKKNIKLSYTNFIEVNTPLFSKNAIEKLMIHLDNSLIGWGIDFLYIWCNGIDKQNSYAIIHDVMCVNPFPINKKKKNIKRELTYITDWNIRSQLWNKYSKKIGCPYKFKIKNYNNIKKK